MSEAAGAQIGGAIDRRVLSRHLCFSFVGTHDNLLVVKRMGKLALFVHEVEGSGCQKKRSVLGNADQ